MAKTGDVVMVPFGTLVAVLESGTVQVRIPTKHTGRLAEDSEIVEFSQDFLRYVKLDGAAPTPPIAVPPNGPGSPSNPIVIPGTPSHPIAPTPGRPDQSLPGGGAHPDQGLPGGGHVSGQPVPGGKPDNTLPSTPGRPDNTLPETPTTKPTPVPPATPKK